MYSRVLKETRCIDRHRISCQLNHIICQTYHSCSSRIIFLILGSIIPSRYASAIIQVSRSVIVNQHSRIKQPLTPWAAWDPLRIRWLPVGGSVNGPSGESACRTPMPLPLSAKYRKNLSPAIDALPAQLTPGISCPGCKISRFDLLVVNPVYPYHWKMKL